MPPLLPLLLLSATAAVVAAPLQPPPISIEQNIGQEEAGVLFTDGERVYRQREVGVNERLRLEFSGADPAATVTGLEPHLVPLRLYNGVDPARWRENVPHFAAVRYERIYPGVDMEWRRTAAGQQPAKVRLLLSPGADPSRIVLRMPGLKATDWTNFTTSITVWAADFFRFEILTAYQIAADGSRVAVRADFRTVDEVSFGLSLPGHDPTRPAIVEIAASDRYFANSITALSPLEDGSILVAGISPPNRGYIARLGPDGQPIFVTRFSAEQTSVRLLASDDRREATLAMAMHGFGRFPVTPGAPRRVPIAIMGDDAWIGRFDDNGRLRAATYTGGPLAAIAQSPGGEAVYFAARDTISRWRPDQPRFDYTIPAPQVASLAVNSSGLLAFVSSEAGENRPITLGALQPRWEGPWSVYAGTLDAVTGSLRMATYVPVYGRSVEGRVSGVSVSLAPQGDLWIGSRIYLPYPYSGSAQTLVALSGDGRRTIYSGSFPDVPAISFDRSTGAVYAAVVTGQPNLRTSLDAPRRARCEDLIYLLTLTAGGAFQDATYVNARGFIRYFDGPGRLFLDRVDFGGGGIERVDTSRPSRPMIACVIHAASRLPRTLGATKLAPGGIYTIVGYRLGGPLEEVAAPLSAPLPLNLAGVEVSVEGLPAPLLSVQQGLITFYLPESAPRRESAALYIRVAGTITLTTNVDTTGASDFAFLTVDGTGNGLIAALNQDGTRNGPDSPARWDSTVALFGIGALPATPTPSRPLLTVSGVRNQTTPVGLVAPDYAGPAPGLPPGVKQINLRLPPELPGGAGWLLIRPTAYLPGGAPSTIIYVAP